jgi:hypothetical protein
MDSPLAFEAFWSWLATHPNCILRAGTPEAVLYDDDDLHWAFGVEDEATLLVQLLRGKRLVAELLVEMEQVAYVEAVPQERAEEHVFELISEAESDRFAAYHFVLVHGFGEEDAPPAARSHVH